MERPFCTESNTYSHGQNAIRINLHVHLHNGDAPNVSESKSNHIAYTNRSLSCTGRVECFSQNRFLLQHQRDQAGGNPFSATGYNGNSSQWQPMPHLRNCTPQRSSLELNFGAHCSQRYESVHQRRFKCKKPRKPTSSTNHEKHNRDRAHKQSDHPVSCRCRRCINRKRKLKCQRGRNDGHFQHQRQIVGKKSFSYRKEVAEKRHRMQHQEVYTRGSSSFSFNGGEHFSQKDHSVRHQKDHLKRQDFSNNLYETHFSQRSYLFQSTEYHSRSHTIENSLSDTDHESKKCAVEMSVSGTDHKKSYTVEKHLPNIDHRECHTTEKLVSDTDDMKLHTVKKPVTCTDLEKFHTLEKPVSNTSCRIRYDSVEIPVLHSEEEEKYLATEKSVSYTDFRKKDLKVEEPIVDTDCRDSSNVDVEGTFNTNCDNRDNGVEKSIFDNSSRDVVVIKSTLDTNDGNIDDTVEKPIFNTDYRNRDIAVSVIPVSDTDSSNIDHLYEKSLSDNNDSNKNNAVEKPISNVDCRNQDDVEILVPDTGCKKRSIPNSIYVESHKCHKTKKVALSSTSQKSFQGEIIFNHRERAKADEKPLSYPDSEMCPHEKNIFAEHQRGNPGKRPSTYSGSDASVIQEKTLKKVEKDHKNGKLYSCTDCGEYFHNAGSLFQHRQTHIDKPFVCQDCGKSFALKIHLKEHCSYSTDKKLLSNSGYKKNSSSVGLPDKSRKVHDGENTKVSLSPHEHIRDRSGRHGSSSHESDVLARLKSDDDIEILSDSNENVVEVFQKILVKQENDIKSIHSNFSSENSYYMKSVEEFSIKREQVFHEENSVQNMFKEEIDLDEIPFENQVGDTFDFWFFPKKESPDQLFDIKKECTCWEAESSSDCKPFIKQELCG